VLYHHHHHNNNNNNNIIIIIIISSLSTSGVSHVSPRRQNSLQLLPSAA
jgi:hypothetical protein